MSRMWMNGLMDGRVRREQWLGVCLDAVKNVLWIGEWANEWMGKWLHVCMDIWCKHTCTCGQMNRWMDGR